jgi:hypothetical protein
VCECVCVCSLALIIPHANIVFSTLHYTALPSVACLAVPYLFHIISLRVRFRGKKLLNTKCAVSLYNASVNISHCKKNSARDYYKYTSVFMCSAAGCSCRVLMKLEFSPRDFRKTFKHQISL